MKTFDIPCVVVSTLLDPRFWQIKVSKSSLVFSISYCKPVSVPPNQRKTCTIVFQLSLSVEEVSSLGLFLHANPLTIPPCRQRSPQPSEGRTRSSVTAGFRGSPQDSPLSRFAKPARTWQPSFSTDLHDHLPQFGRLQTRPLRPRVESSPAFWYLPSEHSVPRASRFSFYRYYLGLPLFSPSIGHQDLFLTLLPN